MTEPEMTDTLYKPVPQGYRGWSCGTDANGECLCGDPDGINPSMAACPYAVLVPDVSQTTGMTPFERIGDALLSWRFYIAAVPLGALAYAVCGWKGTLIYITGTWGGWIWARP